MAFLNLARPSRSGPIMWLAVAAALLAVTLGLNSLGWIVDWLWMGQLGFEPLFWRILATRVGLFIAALLPLSVYFWLNARAAEGTVRSVTGNAAGPYAARLRGFFASRGASALALVGAIVVAFFFALLFQGAWESFLLFRFGGDFGVTEPALGRDAGFYVFRLPFIDAIYAILLSAAAIATLLHVGIFYSLGLLQGWNAADDSARRRALFLLFGNGAFLAMVWAAGYVLDHYRLVYGSGGTVVGPGYTDIHVVIPALWIMAGVMVGVVLFLAWCMRSGRAMAGLIALGGAAILHGTLLWLVPGLVQSLLVSPNELEREREYLARNIQFSRQGFGLDRVMEREFPASAALDLADLKKHRQTIRNIRLWDYRPLLKTFRQIQEIRLYYRFYDVDVDRYRTADGLRQVMLSARELTRDLPRRADTWVNRTLQYTHGYGLAMSLAAQEGSQGSPSLIVKDLPPTGGSGLRADDVAIYYGEHTPGYRIVSTGIREFDYPKGDENVYTRYQGSGGIPLDSFWKRLLFAIDRGDVSILLSEYIQPDSRIQIRQQLRERIESIAPFLRLDRDPYLVLNQGRLVWIQDAYTASNRFPYSESYIAGGRRRLRDVAAAASEPARASHAFESPANYIRNSVKIVVDAMDGDVSFYVIDDNEPILKAWRGAFPDLFRALDDLPEGLKAHLRYPQDLFEAQIRRYRSYHMRTPQVFYNKEDLWTIPRERYGGRRAPVEPYYILVRLPDEDRMQFLLMTPYTPENRDNMIAWMAARSDFPDYGELIVFKLPKERLTFGPMQVEALIDQDTTISRQLSLWDQRGSKVIRGNLLVIPIEQSLIYVEPVYLVAEQHDVPQLKRVIAGNGDRVAMRRTLDGALAALFGGEPAGKPQAAPPSQPPQPVLSEAGDLIGRAERALTEGDWKAFGEAMNRLKRLLSPEEAPGSLESRSEDGSPTGG